MKNGHKKHLNNDIIIKNGLIVDGTGKKPFLGNIYIKGKKIVSINKGDCLSVPYAKVIDLKKKKVIAPGFIDMHAHSDVSSFKTPSMESKVFQGITSEVIGNCGLTPAPASEKNRNHLEDIYHIKDFLKNWKDFGSYLNNMNNTETCLNIIPLVGHGTIHSFYLGYKEKDVSENIIERMRGKAMRSFLSGAWGVSFGLIYPPGCFTKKEEMTALFKEASKQDVIVAVHMRDEGDHVEQALDECLNIACNTKARLHISHLKVFGKNNWKKITSLLKKIREVRKKGIAVTADRYPYIASWTDLDTILPDFVYSKGHVNEIKLLKKKEEREKIKKIFYKNKLYKNREYFKSILISQIRGSENKKYEGKTLYEISLIEKKDPIDVVFDLLVASKLMVSAVFFGMDERNMEKIIGEPYTVIGTDSSAKIFARSSGRPHPRSFGTFPRFFQHFVRNGKMSLEKGVRKCTGLTADIIGLKNRGYISSGYNADLVIFDIDSIEDTSTYMDPVSKPLGIEYVIVNGICVYVHGELTGKRSGNVIFKNK